MFTWLKRWRGHKVRSTSLLAFEPSNADLYNACMSYRHDFGLLSFDEQTRVRDEALYWLRAWGHTLPQFKANAGAVPRRGSDVGTSPLLGDELKGE